MKLLNLFKKNNPRVDNEQQMTDSRSFRMSNLLQGKNILITGSGGNIGKSIALEMAMQGANIFFTEINNENYKELEEELSKYPIESKGFISDVTKHEEIDLLFSSLVKDRIKIDILVNNAGIPAGLTARENLDLKKLHVHFDTNVLGPLYLTKLISQMMMDNDLTGSILFITSIHQWMISLDTGYSASKAAQGMIVKELAVELAPHKIRVNGIAPGYVKENKKGETNPHRYTPLYQSSINPGYIGRAAVYLSSDYFSKFTTGTIIKIDGGLSLFNHLVDQTFKK